MKRLKGSLRFQRGCLLPKYHQAVDVGSPPQGALIMCPCCLKNFICHTSIWAKYVAVVWLLSRFLLWDTMTAACQASLSFTISQSLLKFMFIESVMLSNHLILFFPLLLWPSIFPSIRVFSNELALWIRWPKYRSFCWAPNHKQSLDGIKPDTKYFRVYKTHLMAFHISQHIFDKTYFICLQDVFNGFSSSHVWMSELDHRDSRVPKNWCFWTGVLEKAFESPLDCKEIKAVSPKGNQSWIFIGRTDAEAETPILWPPDAKSWLIGKVGHNWATELNWTDRTQGLHHNYSSLSLKHQSIQKTHINKWECLCSNKTGIWPVDHSLPRLWRETRGMEESSPPDLLSETLPPPFPQCTHLTQRRPESLKCRYPGWQHLTFLTLKAASVLHGSQAIKQRNFWDHVLTLPSKFLPFLRPGQFQLDLFSGRFHGRGKCEEFQK